MLEAIEAGCKPGVALVLAHWSKKPSMNYNHSMDILYMNGIGLSKPISVEKLIQKCKKGSYINNLFPNVSTSTASETKLKKIRGFIGQKKYKEAAKLLNYSDFDSPAKKAIKNITKAVKTTQGKIFKNEKIQERFMTSLEKALALKGVNYCSAVDKTFSSIFSETFDE
jgi:hypothetical protein